MPTWCTDPADLCDIDFSLCGLPECEQGPCSDLDNRYQVAWLLISAVSAIFENCGIEQPCDGFGVDIGTEFRAAPGCCEMVGVLIEPPFIDPEVTPASTRACVPPWREHYRIILSRCRAQGETPVYGSPGGEEPDTINAAARCAVRDLEAVLRGLRDAWCCVVDQCEGGCGGCLSCDSLTVLEVETLPEGGTCHGWSIRTEIR